MAIKSSNMLSFDSEEEAVLALQREGKNLKDICEKVWRLYEASYTPKKYVRKHKFFDSIKLGKVKKLSDDTLMIEVTFVDRLAYHDSIFNTDKKTHKQGHSIMLISEGWKAKNPRIKGRYRLGYYEGYNFIGKVKEMYEASRNNKVYLEVEWAGSEFKKKKTQKNVLR